MRSAGPVLAAFLAALCLAPRVHAAAPVTDASTGGNLSARLDKLEQLLNNRGLLDMLNQIQALQEQVNRLRGQIEVQNHALEQLRAAQRDQYVDIDRRLQRLEAAAGIATTSTSVGGDASPSGNPPLQTLSPASTAGDQPDTGNGGSPLTVELVGQQPAVTNANGNAATPAGGGPGSATPDTGMSTGAPGTAAVAGTATPPAAGAGVSAGNREPAASDGGNTPAANPPVAAAEPQNGAAQAAAPQPAAPQTEPDPVKARADYQQAFKLLRSALYDQAIKAFQEFLQVHPASEYADNAQYWLGETYLATRQFDKALAQYQQLVDAYPRSTKVPDAMLKIGYTFQEMGNLAEAKARLEVVRQRFPGTTAARLAEERLDALKNAAQPGAAAN